MPATHPAVNELLVKWIEARPGRGLQAQLARHLGVDATTVTAWKQGRSSPEPERWAAIEKFFDERPGSLAAAASVPVWSVSARDSAVGTDSAHVEQLPQWGVDLRSEVAELAERLGLVQAAVDQLIAAQDPGGEVVPFRRAAKEPGATETGPRSDRPGNEAPEGQEEPP